MKRLLVTIILLLLSICTTQAQVGVYRSNGVIKKEKKEYRELREREQREREEKRIRDSIDREKRIKMEQDRMEKKRLAEEEQRLRDSVSRVEYTRKRQERKEKLTHSVVLNYAWTGAGGTSNLGITYSNCKIGGFYISAMTGLEWHMANVKGYVSEYLVTNKTSHPRISLTAGGVIRFGSAPMWAYIGAGYAYRGLNYRTVDGKWVKYPVGKYNLGSCPDFEVGMMGSIKGVTLQAGLSLFVSGEETTVMEVKAGIGYTFKNKKKTIITEGGE